MCHEISKLFDFENMSLEKLSHKLLPDRDKHLSHATVRDNGKVKTIGHNMNLFIQIFQINIIAKMTYYPWVHWIIN
jgi:hypothetical protein